MSLLDPSTRNGYAPMPGTVHRPTRSGLPPALGPNLPAAPTVGPGSAHNPHAYVSVPERETTTGSHIPKAPRLTEAFYNHGYTKHVETTEDGRCYTILPDVHPKIVTHIHALAKRINGDITWS